MALYSYGTLCKKHVQLRPLISVDYKEFAV